MMVAVFLNGVICAEITVCSLLYRVSDEELPLTLARLELYIVYLLLLCSPKFFPPKPKFTLTHFYLKLLEYTFYFPTQSY